MATNNETGTPAPQASPRWGWAAFKSAFGVALGVLLAVVLVLGVLAVVLV